LELVLHKGHIHQKIRMQPAAMEIGQPASAPLATASEQQP
jgi:hypothetical protein